MVSGNGTTTPYYVHRDHLRSTNVLTAQDQSPVETITYYPFGGLKSDVKQASFNERKKFTGHQYDAESGLYYMQARYQSPTIGRFVSEDPAFWKLPAKILTNPQKLNSYSYVNNNPINKNDPTGKFGWPGALIGGAIGAGFGAMDVYMRNPDASINDYKWGAFKGGSAGATAGFTGAYVPILAGAAIVGAESALQDWVSGDHQIDTAGVALDVVSNLGGGVASAPYQLLRTSSRLGMRLIETNGALVSGMVGLGISGVSNNRSTVNSCSLNACMMPSSSSRSSGQSNSNSSSSSRSNSSGSSSSVNWSAVRAAVQSYYASGGK